MFCQKLQKEATPMPFKPYPGELGERIVNNISWEAWQQWLEHQTILINEYRLNMLDAKSKEFLTQEMEKFFFGEGSEKPDAYTPQE
jgi:Fe-S cluster biosynthesis and repair protein YggX